MSLYRCLIAKLNSKNDIWAEGIFHPLEIHWVTKPKDTLYLHIDTSWISCHTKAQSFNKGILSKIVQLIQKFADNSDHMKIIRNCQILLLVTITPITITMTQTLTLTKNGSEEEMDGTRNVLKQVSLISTCQDHLLLLHKPIQMKICFQPGPYFLRHLSFIIFTN